MIKLRSFLKIIGLGSLAPISGLPNISQERGKRTYNGGHHKSIEWCITRNILLPCLDSEGKLDYDTNKYGKYYMIIGDVTVLKEKLNESLRFCFESRPIILEELNDKFVDEFLSIVDKHAEKIYPDGYSLITGMPKRYSL